MVVTFDGKRYGFSYLDITVGQLMTINRLYGLTLKDIQSFDIQHAKGSVVSCLYWLMLCQNNVYVHPEAINCNIIKFIDAFIIGCNKESTHPRPKKKKKKDEKFSGTDFASEAYLARQKLIDERKSMEFTENAENADFTELFINYVIEFSFLMKFTPDQVEALKWHVFVSYVEGIKQHRKSEAVQAQKQAQIYGM